MEFRKHKGINKLFLPSFKSVLESTQVTIVRPIVLSSIDFVGLVVCLLSKAFDFVGLVDCLLNQ
jgi:hypothetical protein